MAFHHFTHDFNRKIKRSNKYSVKQIFHNFFPSIYHFYVIQENYVKRTRDIGPPLGEFNIEHYPISGHRSRHDQKFNFFMGIL